MEIVLTRNLSRKPADNDLLTPSELNPRLQRSCRDIVSEEDVVQVLEDEPSLEELTIILQWLTKNHVSINEFDIKSPSASASKILNVFVTKTIPDFWTVLEGDAALSQVRFMLTEILRSTPGIAALVLAIRARVQSFSAQASNTRSSGPEISFLSSTRHVLIEVLGGSNTINAILNAVLKAKSEKDMHKRLWNQALPLFAGGRILSTLAEADQVLRVHGNSVSDISLTKGEVYAAWLGHNIRSANLSTDEAMEEKVAAIATLFGKSLGLGFNSALLEAVLAALLSGDDTGCHKDLQLLHSLKLHEQKRVLIGILDICSSEKFRSRRPNIIPGLSWLLHLLHQSSPFLVKASSEWLIGVDQGRTAADITVHRAMVTALSTLSEGSALLSSLLNDLIAVVGDKLYIQNAPILQQEMQIRDLLLIVGHFHKTRPSEIRQFSKSSSYINAISNRISASASRPQFLGMVLAIAVSSLVDDPGSRITFEDSLTDNNDNAKEFTDLVNVIDVLGSLQDLEPTQIHDEAKRPANHGRISIPISFQANKTSKKHTKGLKVVDDDSASSGHDSDFEDDPTIANKKKPPPPVYIRDLLAGLRDTDNHERYHISLSHAAALIRRKTSFGTEVSDHIEELASELAGAKDALNDRKHADYQLDGMVAVICAAPQKMSPWFSISAFSGDYSISQRMAMLSALALAAREIAGYKTENKPATHDIFPPKRLPPGLRAFEELGLSHPRAVDSIATNLRMEMIQPMAASAADKVSGPDHLKIRTFSSRLKEGKRGKRLIRNDLSKIVMESFFSPLTDRFRLEMNTRGSGSPFTTSILMAHYLKTLALIAASAGPNTLSLPDLTTDFFAICLASRVQSAAVSHLPVLDSLLFCYLTILDVNSASEKSFVLDHGSNILEIKAWVEDVLERVASGDSEHEQVRVLASGVLVRCADIISNYQQSLMAKMAEFV